MSTTYACINQGEAVTLEEIADRSICIDGDIGEVIEELKKENYDGIRNT